MGSARLIASFSSRQAMFFLLAIALPCALLVILTLRMLVQDRELADKRAAEERQRLVTAVRQDLLTRVEAARRGAMRDPDGGGLHASGEVALVAQIDGGRLVLPWERDTDVSSAAAAMAEPAFRQAVRNGEEQEFISGDYIDAAAAYRTALAGARIATQRAAAQLLLARALAKGGQTTEAERIYRDVVERAPAVVDDQGIPFSLYAARRLIESDAVSTRTRERTIALLRDVLASASLRPTALYMARDVLGALQARTADPGTLGISELATAIAARTRAFERALELQRGFPNAALAAALAAPPGEPVWVPFGGSDDPWLVGASGGADGGVVLALRAEPVFAAARGSSAMGLASWAGVRFSTEGEGEPLRPSFPGVGLVLPPATTAALAGEGLVAQPVYVAALALVVGAALFGAYFSWRDVRREIRIAEMRSQFVSSVSHELKTPLTAIRMFAETLLLGRAARAEVTQEYLETIVNESERLTRLLNNVLDFSKIEQGTKTYRLAPQSPAVLVHTAAKAMQYPLAQQGFDLRVRIAGDVPAIAADPDAIQQAILNLLSNAMKYSGQDRVIELTLSEDAGHAVIAVTDHGIGIPRAEHKRIFEKFYRVPGEDNLRIAGTGLGLTLVDHVARAHGGSVALRSAPGEGSTFALRLPVAADPAGTISEASAIA